jgi:hypothetical protein
MTAGNCSVDTRDWFLIVQPLSRMDDTWCGSDSRCTSWSDPVGISTAGQLQYQVRYLSESVEVTWRDTLSRAADTAVLPDKAARAIAIYRRRPR